MYSKVRRPSEIIALQKKVIEDQEGIITLLKAALAASGEEVVVPTYHAWMQGLTPQEQALLGVLFQHYPNPVDKYELLELIPGYDHVAERQAQLVSVKVHHLRKKLGADAIENVWGRGYRLGARQHEAMLNGELGVSSAGLTRPAANEARVAEELGQRLAAIGLAVQLLKRDGANQKAISTIELALDEARHELQLSRRRRPEYRTG